MDPLTWTGSLSFLNPVFLTAGALLVIAFLLQFLLGLFGMKSGELVIQSDGTALRTRTPMDYIGFVTMGALLVALACVVGYLLVGMLLPGEAKGIIGHVSARLLPVWVAMALVFALSYTFKRRLGLYGKLFDSTVGMIGFGIVLFWVFTALFHQMILTHDPLTAVSGLKNKIPGTPTPEGTDGLEWYLLGGDNLARDVFSRMVAGAWEVMKIAPFATIFAFMVGITLGLPAGYYGGKLDTFLSFLANLILAFPVILLFYLLVTPEIVASGLPRYMAGVLFLFPILFLVVLFNSRYFTDPTKRALYIGLSVVIGGYIYLGVAWDADPLGMISMEGNILVVFVSVVFVNSPTVFRIVRGLALDIKTRDYVAAAQTRGEGPWYIMLWEILPNARGPLIVDFCLRIGYTTILLGTLGFFGLGLPPDSPDWGTTINSGRKLLSIYPHPALAPALALMSLVLGLNLLADGLREESLRD
ncbi:ABC transporter permease [Oceanicola sp. D3]|uniref:ABC transporter permease n=1 Tax=Oceanicola sp. D3 TaxID=2587163 RepID=UPI001120BD42|nr:ABC transporter permease [Oceanicola sp. D3]QDC09653.1 ABC transporter permease [Oceanicola sp. D3]